MRLVIIPEDRFVIVDDFGLDNIQQDFSWIPNDVHAVQWFDTYGHIEYKDSRPNLEIVELGIYERAIELLNDEIQRREDIAESLNDYEESFIRMRDKKLYESDWTQLPDSPLTQEQKELWAVYRQVLRDLPTNISDCKELVLDQNHPDWPTPPWEIGGIHL